MTDSPLKIWRENDGRLLRLRLSKPKANIIDAKMIGALDAAFKDAGKDEKLLAVLLDHEGPHFSFGASVEEHMPGQCAAMLKALHGLIAEILTCPVPVLVAVNGQCLGGGLEVALAASMIFAGSRAAFGQPEIRIGVFAPAASCLLPRLIGQTRAEDLLFSGGAVTADEALKAGLVKDVSENGEAAALEYVNEHLDGLSASTLRFAVRAARGPFADAVIADLNRVEDLYLQDLMQSHDAVEGLKAFVEKRQAKWEHR